MNEKEFKRLSRSDLIDIIYQFQKNEANLVKTNEELKARLAAREMKIADAGSIAEAAVAVSGLFEKAQQAADIYLAEIEKMNEDIDERCWEKIYAAEREAERIIAEAEVKAKAKIAAANKAIHQYVLSHPEIRPALFAQEDDDES